jgi:hypothetical protein
MLQTGFFNSSRLAKIFARFIFFEVLSMAQMLVTFLAPYYSDFVIL